MKKTKLKRQNIATGESEYITLNQQVKQISVSSTPVTFSSNSAGELVEIIQNPANNMSLTISSITVDGTEMLSSSVVLNDNVNPFSIEWDNSLSMTISSSVNNTITIIYWEA
ncbi:MAG: hypothetical protein QW478_13120 [Candidatus Micrarchaeaceae archaeon]